MQKSKLLSELEKAKKLPAVIVEGKKDKIALEKLGFKNVICLHRNGHSMYEVIEKINCKECAILTDFDRKGKYYYRILRKEFSKKGIKVVNSLRRILSRENITHIEGLPTFLRTKYKKLFFPHTALVFSTICA
ncbi:hypothetical protein DRJ16_01705 [Candidatus Woesearchaeota archaeon]|nr:MAG: hypothetical protein DRJ16_01705 [Candidatus Woesearchaeota archaeon]